MSTTTPFATRPVSGPVTPTTRPGRTGRPGRPEPRLVEEPWLSSTVVVPSDRCGPPGMGNGGWVSGTVAGHLDAGPVEVTLHAPTPLDTPLGLRAADDEASLDHEGQVLVTARRVAAWPIPTEPVTWEEAVWASGRFAGHESHPFPGCFVCGTARHAGDGLRLFAGPVSRRPGTVAAPYEPHPAHTIDGERLGPAAVWALLDCPSAWVAYGPGKVALLGRLTGQVRGEVRVGRRYVVVGRMLHEDDRKLRSAVAVHEVGGGPVAAGLATWVRIPGPGPA